MHKICFSKFRKYQGNIVGKMIYAQTLWKVLHPKPKLGMFCELPGFFGKTMNIVGILKQIVW